MALLRIGQGIDIHAFDGARKLILGGVEIPSDVGLAGHSDADVVLHAVTDAILGALGEGDIGTRFPDTEERWRGASSSLFVKDVWREATQRGYILQNLDINILAQKPKISPYVSEMKGHLSALLEASPSQIAIKATTTERLGFVGREEGILATAVVLLSGRA